MAGASAVKAGRLRQRITLQAKSVTRDAMGGEVITWADQVTIWASAEPLRGREFFAAQQEQAEISIRFVIRYRSDVTTAWRVMWETRAYDIVEIIDIDGRHKEQQIMARTQQNA